MAAGTGGHVIPGLAIARELRERGHTLSWLGTPSGMENKLVPAEHIELHRTSFDGLRGKGFMGAFLGGWQLLRAFAQSLSLIRKAKVDVVLGMGGYVCFPGGIAAAALGKPLVLVNADAGLLLSNKALLPFADAITFGFDSVDARAVKNAVLTGNPVRASIRAVSAPELRFAGRSGSLKLLVLGGSSGAKFLNETVPQALALMPESERPQLVHQTGAAHIAAVQANYAALGLKADLRAFIDDMAHELANCDAVLCRAGAITISELCAAGVASVLVPLVVSTTSHQARNAECLAGQGAAQHLPQAGLDASSLANVLRGLQRPALLQMAQAAKSLDRAGATQTIADLCETLHAATHGRAPSLGGRAS